MDQRFHHPWSPTLVFQRRHGLPLMKVGGVLSTRILEQDSGTPDVEGNQSF